MKIKLVELREKNEEKNNIIEIKAMLWRTKNRINVTKKKDKDYTNSPSKVLQAKNNRDFPGNPVVKTPYFHCQGPRYNPWSGN